MHFKMDWSVPSRTSAHKGVEMQQWRRRQTASPRNTILSLFILSVIYFCFTRMTLPPRREERPEKPKARRQNELSEKIMDFNPTLSFIRFTGVSHNVNVDFISLANNWFLEDENSAFWICSGASFWICSGAFLKVQCVRLRHREVRKGMKFWFWFFKSMFIMLIIVFWCSTQTKNLRKP